MRVLLRSHENSHAFTRFVMKIIAEAMGLAIKNFHSRIVAGFGNKPRDDRKDLNDLTSTTNGEMHQAREFILFPVFTIK